jgi:hypothetical protein
MRAIHNTPIPHEEEFPIPDDCVCETDELCEACLRVVAEDLQEQERERSFYTE